MSRKKKFSQNWKRAKARLACLHIRVANARRDYLHKASTAISKNHAIVCVEDLRVSNMSSSAAGSMQSPGSKVRAKSGLNRSILDQGWAELRRQLEYKLGWNGGRLIAVPAINTSRTCPECRCTGQGNRKSQARFCCVECGYEANADLVAAINVGRAGLARIACEVNDGVSRQQQEPTSVAAWPRRLESPSFRCPLGGGGRQHAANWIHSFVVAESSEKASRFVPEVSRLAGLREPTPEGYESLAGLLSS
jgi:putative transposase